MRSRIFAAALAAGAASLALPRISAAGSAESTTPSGAALAQFGAPVADGIVGPDGPRSFDATLPNGRRVTPAGTSVQVGQQPLNSVLTPDGRFLVTTNDDERGGSGTGTTFAPQDAKNGAAQSLRGYSLAVVDTATMKVVTTMPVPANLTPHAGSVFNGKKDSDKTNGLFLGVAVTAAPSGGYTVYAAGGPADVVYTFTLGLDGKAGAVGQIPMPVPTDRAQATYGMGAPGGMRVSPDGRTLWVAMNNGNSVVPVDLATNKAGDPIAAGYFPYDVETVAGKLFVSNWGVTTRTFADGQGAGTDSSGNIRHTGSNAIGGAAGANRFDSPDTSARSSSVSVLDLVDRTTAGTIDLARPIDGTGIVGGTHPSALAAVGGRGAGSSIGNTALYAADTNEDTIAVIDPFKASLVKKIALPSPGLPRPDATEDDQDQAQPTLGLMPDALAVSPDQRTLYVAEAGLNSVAVYDVTAPKNPRFEGRIPTGWWPSAVTVSPDGHSLFVTNAKGAGSPYHFQGAVPNTSPASPDDNYSFGSVQKIDLASLDLATATRHVRANTVRVVTPDRGLLSTLQSNIKHVVFILRENKSYDAYLGDDGLLNQRGGRGQPSYANFGADVPNTKAAAEQFTVGDNNYADSEESNAGHSYALAGTSTDYQQKTLLSRFARPLVNVKNEDPEDYPLQGYIFNAMARNGRSFRDYGDNVRISGYDEGAASNFCADDPKPNCNNATYNNIHDTTSSTAGLGGQYSETLPALKVLAGHLDENYPGWNLHISDQRRAAEFVNDFGALVAAGKAPEFTSLWLPDDHTGGCATNGVSCTPHMEVADNDAGLGQVLDYLTHSPIWKSTAVFITEDDTQGSADHVNAHRTYTEVISPYARRGTVVHALGSTVSVPKTAEEILGLPPMNYGDLLANDLLSYFTATPDTTPFTPAGGSRYQGHGATAPAVAAADVDAGPPEARRIWALVDRLDTSTYDADSERVGQLGFLYDRSADLARDRGSLSDDAYAAQQDQLYAQAVSLTS